MELEILQRKYQQAMRQLTTALDTIYQLGAELEIVKARLAKIESTQQAEQEESTA